MDGASVHADIIRLAWGVSKARRKGIHHAMMQPTMSEKQQKEAVVEGTLERPAELSAVTSIALDTTL